MPQLLNMLAASPKEPQAANTIGDSQSIDNNGFSELLADEKSKVDLSQPKESRHPRDVSSEQAEVNEKAEQKPEKADANLILRQIQMGEELDKGQNIAAEGENLPLDDLLLTNELPLLEEHQLSQPNPEPEQNVDELTQEQLVTKLQSDEAKVPVDTISPIKGEIVEEAIGDETHEGEDVVASSVIEESSAAVIATSVNSINDEAKQRAESVKPQPELLSTTSKQDKAALEQLAKAQVTVIDNNEVQSDELINNTELDKKLGRILGVADGDIKSKASAQNNLISGASSELKGEEAKALQGKNGEAGLDKVLAKMGLSNQAEVSEKVANFQSHQVARESAQSSVLEFGSRELGLSSANSLSSASPSAHANQSQVVQLSLRQAGDQPVHMQEVIARFNPVMKQQLVTMVKNGVQQAEIRLDPPELGSMMVRVQVQGDQTQVQFQAAQPQTRELLEQAIPRLRDMLSEQGMELTDSQVSQENHSQQGGNDEGFDGDEGRTVYEMNEISAEDLPLGTNQATSYPSGIDYYA